MVTPENEFHSTRTGLLATCTCTVNYAITCIGTSTIRLHSIKSSLPSLYALRHSHDKLLKVLYRFSILQVMESWAGPENEANRNSLNRMLCCSFTLTSFPALPSGCLISWFMYQTVNHSGTRECRLFIVYNSWVWATIWCMPQHSVFMYVYIYDYWMSYQLCLTSDHCWFNTINR